MAADAYRVDSSRQCPCTPVSIDCLRQNGVLCRSLLVKLVATWSIDDTDRYNYCPAEGCHFINIAATFGYRLFPVGEQNVVLEQWNYVLDRSANVTTIVVQNNGKLVVSVTVLHTM